MKKLPSKVDIREMIEDLVLGTKYLSKRRKVKLKSLLKSVDGCSSGHTDLEIIMIVGDTYLEFPIIIGEPKVTNINGEEE